MFACNVSTLDQCCVLIVRRRNNHTKLKRVVHGWNTQLNSTPNHILISSPFRQSLLAAPEVHVSTFLWRPLCTSCGDGRTPLLHVWPGRTALDQATHLYCHPMPSFPQTEQLLLIVMHEFSHFVLHAAHVFVPVGSMDNPEYSPCISHFPLPFTRLQLLLVLFQLFLNRLSDLAHPRSCSFRCLDCVVLPRACLSALAHLLCNRTPTRLALVIVRTLSLTNPGTPSSHAANPNMHRSATAVLVHGHDLRHTLHSRIHFWRERLASFLASLSDVPSIAGSVSHLSVTVLCPS